MNAWLGFMQANIGVHEKGTVDFQELLASLRRNPNFSKAGAIATFIGVVRGDNLKNEKVQKLELEAYEEKANETLKNICNDLKKKQGIVDVQIHHMLGEFSVGEDLVYVVVAGAHRKDVFAVLEEAVERYKKEAPIFKKEHVGSEKGETRAYWTKESEGEE
jgi:molybdopterin synthase catalytic subunit